MTGVAACKTGAQQNKNAKTRAARMAADLLAKNMMAPVFKLFALIAAF